MPDESAQGASRMDVPPEPPPPNWGMPPYSIPLQNRGLYPSLLGAIWQTLRLVLFHPARAFFNVQVVGAMGQTVPYLAIMMLLASLVQRGGFLLLMLSLDIPEGASAALGFPSWVIWWGVCMVFDAVLAIIVSFVFAATCHVMLMMLGTNDRGFGGTYCVVGYALGSTAVFWAVPYVGWVVAGVWCIVVSIVGLTRVDRISTGRAAAAVLLALAACLLAAIGPLVILYILVLRSFPLI